MVCEVWGQSMGVCPELTAGNKCFFVVVLTAFATLSGWVRVVVLKEGVIFYD